MAYANSAISDVIATSIESRSKQLADNLTNNNALLFYLKKQGNVKSITGGSSILEELYYDDPNTNNANSYSGYDVLNITPDSPISSAQFAMKNYSTAVSIAGTEILANSGKEQMISLIDSRLTLAESRLMNKIDSDLHGDGTANSGKALVGLAAMNSTTPTTGVYGAIDRAVWSFWRNVSTTSTIVNGGAATSATIQKLMNAASLAVVRGADRVNFIYAGSTFYSLYLESLQAIQRIGETNEGGAGFTALKYFGAGGSADVVLGGGVGGNQSATRADFINTKHVFFRTHKDRNFVAIGGDKQSTNQDAVVKLLGWSGALTCNGARFNAVALTS